MIKRHFLVEITDKGRQIAFETFSRLNPNSENLQNIKEIIVQGIDSKKIPGIIRREEKATTKETIAVGFSSPYIIEGERLRVPAFIPKNEVVSVVSPYQVAEFNFTPRNNCLLALKELINFTKQKGINIGIWGSVALEIFTTLPYTKENSDLDVLITCTNFNTLMNFSQYAKNLEKKYNTRIDLELDLPNGYGTKVAELFLNVDEILCKSIKDVRLFKRATIMKMLK